MRPPDHCRLRRARRSSRSTFGSYNIGCGLGDGRPRAGHLMSLLSPAEVQSEVHRCIKRVDHGVGVDPDDVGLDDLDAERAEPELLGLESWCVEDAVDGSPHSVGAHSERRSSASSTSVSRRSGAAACPMRTWKLITRLDSRRREQQLHHRAPGLLELGSDVAAGRCLHRDHGSHAVGSGAQHAVYRYGDRAVGAPNVG